MVSVSLQAQSTRKSAPFWVWALVILSVTCFSLYLWNDIELLPSNESLLDLQLTADNESLSSSSPALVDIGLARNISSTTEEEEYSTIQIDKHIAMLPNLLLVGAQKAGTTALSMWLFAHKGVCQPRYFPGEPRKFRKEVHFFDLNHRYMKGKNFYSKRFSHCSGKHWRLDATPASLRFANRVRRFYDDAGGNLTSKLRILMILRDPVARDLSLYNFMVSLVRTKDIGHRKSEFYHAVLGEDRSTIMSFTEFSHKLTLPIIPASDGACSGNGNICNSFYGQYVTEWMDAFDPMQILVLSHDELRKEPARLMERVRHFLGFEENGPNVIETANHRSSPYKVGLPECLVQKELAAAYEASTRKLYKLLESRPRPVEEQHPFPQFKPMNCT